MHYTFFLQKKESPDVHHKKNSHYYELLLLANILVKYRLINKLILYYLIMKTLHILGARGRALDDKKAFGKVWDQSKKHNLIPKDKKLFEKIGLDIGERIHYFASFSGEWAKALAEQGLNVDASDVSKQRVDKLKRDPKKVNPFVRQLPAQIHNIVPNYYDWSVSFEPHPLLETGLRYVIRTALLNRKGLKIILGPHSKNYGEYKRICQMVAKLYGAQIPDKLESTTISGKLQTDQERYTSGDHNILIITILTNPEARRKAELDIFVERKLEKYSGDKYEFIKKIAKEFNISEKKITESVERVTIFDYYFV